MKERKLEPSFNKISPDMYNVLGHGSQSKSFINDKGFEIYRY